MRSTSLASPQTLNLYVYCTNDPINHTDPSGLGFFSFLKKIFKGIAKILTNKWVLLAVGIAAGIGAAFAFYWAVGSYVAGFFIKAGIFLAGTSAALVTSAFHPNVQRAFQIAGAAVSAFQSVRGLIDTLRGPGAGDLWRFITPWNQNARLSFRGGRGSPSVNTATLNDCTQELFGVELRSFTGSRRGANGSFIGYGPDVIRAGGNNNTYTIVNDVTKYTAADLIKVHRTLSGKIERITGMAFADYPWLNHTARNISALEILKTQIHELGHSLDVLTGIRYKDHGIEAGSKLENCVNRRGGFR